MAVTIFLPLFAQNQVHRVHMEAHYCLGGAPYKGDLLISALYTSCAILFSWPNLVPLVC